MSANEDCKGSEACPSWEALTAFHAGQLPLQAVEAIAAHVEGCAPCSATLDKLVQSAAPLLPELRVPSLPEPLGEAEARRAAALAERVGNHLARSRGDAPVPGRLGQYQLLECLGAGGMGQVFKACHALMNRTVALKVLRGQDLDHPDAVRRFHQEIRALARLSHPNIVAALDADQEGDTHFLVMEYVDGVDLAHLVRQNGPLPVAEACDCVRQAALGLQHAHEHGLVHRDVKPANLIRTPQGQVKVLDLGLARFRAGGASPKGESLTGHVLGTADYMAPEQWDDTHAVDIRADIYSLGCTLYYLLTGEPPFGDREGGNLQKMKAHAEAPVPPIQKRRPELPDGLAAVLQRLLAKDPACRYATPAEVAEALQPFADGREGRRPEETSPIRKDRRRVRRRGGLVTALAALALLLLALTGWGLRPLFVGSSVTSQAAQRDAVLAEPLRVSLRVSHYRGDPADLLGYLGTNSYATLHEDAVRVHVELGEAAYGYLIAFNPDGTEQLCPKDPTTPPPQTSGFDYPRTRYFNVGSDSGLQAFVQVVSRAPLPAYREWRRRAGAAPWSKEAAAAAAKGVWQYDGRRLELLGVERGPEEERAGPLKTLSDQCHFFETNCPEVDAVRLVAFPVQAKPLPQKRGGP
jgi:serine/threonine protein kinase